MISMDVLPEIMECKDKDDTFIISRVIKNRNYLYKLLDGLTLKIDRDSIDYQPIELLEEDVHGSIWGELPVRLDFIEMLKLAGIISISDDKKYFKLLVHNPYKALEHSNKLIDVIGWDKLQEVKALPLPDLILYLNSNELIKNAYELDKKIWLGE
jgi:hypothetical protein